MIEKMVYLKTGRGTSQPRTMDKSTWLKPVFLEKSVHKEHLNRSLSIYIAGLPLLILWVLESSP